MWRVARRLLHSHQALRLRQFFDARREQKRKQKWFMHLASHLWITRAFGPSLPWTVFLVFSYNAEEAGKLINGAESEVDVQMEYTLFFYSHHTKGTRMRKHGVCQQQPVSGVLSCIFVAPFSPSFICCKDWAKIPAGKLVCTFCEGHS